MTITSVLQPHRQNAAYTWSYDLLCPILVTVGITWDWIPGYVGGDRYEAFTLTRLIVIPLILIDFIKNRRSYLHSAAGYGWFFAFAVLLGVGSGVLLDVVSATRFVSLLPTIAILLFYLKPRAESEVYRILTVAFWASLVVPLVLLLAYLGVFSPSQSVDLGSSLRRIWAGTSSSSYSVYALVPAATLGGLIVGSRCGWYRPPLAVLAVLLGFTGTLLTGQRISTATFLLCIWVSIFLTVGLNKARIWRDLAWCIVILGFIVTLLGPDFQELAQTVSYRFEVLNTSAGYQDSQNRLMAFEVLFNDLVTRPELVASGQESVIDRLGIGSHWIFGEAYYDGGLVLFSVLTWGFIASLVNTGRHYLNGRRGSGSYSALVLFSLALGCLIVLCINPGLQTRFVYLVLGLSIASNSWISSSQ